MKRPIMILLMLAVCLNQCSRGHVNKRGQTATGEGPGTPGGDPAAEIPLVQLPATGSQFRFLDAIALTDIYSRVFIKDANGRWKGCGDDAGWCQKSMFSKEEARFLGTFSLMDGVDSFRVKKDFTLNYTRSLRAMLYRECRNLVDVEWARFANSATQNTLVFRQQVPDTADLDHFSRKLFGLSGTTIKIDNAAEDYRLAFASAVAMKKDPESLKSGYVVTCMAMAMDPAVFLY